MSSRLEPGQKLFTINAVQQLGIDRKCLMTRISYGPLRFGITIFHQGRSRRLFAPMEMYPIALSKRLSDFGLPWSVTARILDHFTATDWNDLKFTQDNFLVVEDPGTDGAGGRGTVGERIVFARDSKADASGCRIAVVIDLRLIKQEVDGILSRAVEGVDFIITE